MYVSVVCVCECSECSQYSSVVSVMCVCECSECM